MAADTIDVLWRGLTLAHEGPHRVAAITGWEDLPSPRVEAIDRPYAHGTFDSPVWGSARTVTVEGYCIDPDARSHLLAQLGATTTIEGDDPSSDLTVTFADRTLTARARLTRASTSLRNWGVGHFGWQIEWWCPDPYRYGPGQAASTGVPLDVGGLTFPLFTGSGLLGFGGISSPGRITLTNAGTAAAWPVLDILGPLGGAEIIELTTGRRIRWDSDIPDGVHLSIDTRSGTVSYDGQAGFDGSLTARQWWSIPPGGSRIAQLNPLGASSGSSLLSAAWASTYW